MEQHTILRFGEPNQFDQEPYGTICVVKTSLNKEATRYKQVSRDEQHPHWELQEDYE